MLKQINNWHLSVLVAIVSIISIAMIQQYAEAQWTDPGNLPGGTPANNLVVNPMTETLQVGGQEINGNFLKIDADDNDVDNKVIKVSAGKEICFGNTDCASAWPTVSGGSGTSLWSTSTVNMNDIYYIGGNVGIGTSNPSYALEVTGDNGAGDVMKVKGTGYSSDIIFYNDLDVWAGAIGYENRKLNRVDLFSIASGQKDMRFLTGSNVNNWGTERMRIQQSTGNVGIGTTTPNKNLHVYDGSGANAEIDLQSGSNTHWGMYQNVANADLTFWNGNDRVTFTDTGNVGIGTTQPDALLELYNNQVDGSNLKIRNDSGDMRIIFQEYSNPPTSYGDMSIRYNGNNPGINNGYANWLEFWGRNPDTDDPIMTMQRDYVPTENNFLGVGIGVPSLTNINAKLRVQNKGTEDIFQAYDDNIEVFSIKDGGQLCLNGSCINDWTNAGSGPLSSYTVTCHTDSNTGQCNSSCLASDFVLTDWTCTPDDSSSNIYPAGCIQGTDTGTIDRCWGSSNCTGVGTCTNFTNPPLVPLSSYTVTCHTDGNTNGQCSSSCLSSDFVLTDWICTPDNLVSDTISPADCIQGTDTGTIDRCWGSSNCTGVGTCTKFQ